MSLKCSLSKLLLLSNLRSTCRSNLPVLSWTHRALHVTSRCRDRYPKFYIKPLYRDEDLENMRESGEAAKLAYIPVRAADTDETQSVWHDPLLAKFINMIMDGGQKHLARTQLETAFENIKRIQLDKYYEAKTDAERAKVILDPYTIFRMAIENGRPLLETVPVKKGGSTYQVPIPLGENKSQWYAMKWLVEAGNTKEDTMRFHVKLAYELLDAANNTGRVVKKKQDLHKLCEANRAFAHFRWN